MTSHDKITKKMNKFIAEAFSYESAMKAYNITQNDVDNFREMLRSSEYVPKAIMDKVLLIVLITCRNNKDKSVNLLQNYCKFNREAPEFFAIRDIASQEVQQALDNQFNVSL